MEKALYDKTGREIMAGDILKVFHFVGARRKRHYMYKQALKIEQLGKADFMKIGHLNLYDRDDGYHELLDGRILRDYEIVQGFGGDGVSFEDRPKLKA